MDIYGYNNFPYNQSDDLTKELLSQQAYRSVESHMMPAPSGIPWNVQGLPWGMNSPPQVMQFTGQPAQLQFTPVVHSKRKSLDIEPTIPAKQLITEEKMAAHLNSLHISSDYTTHALASEMDYNLIDPPALTEKLKGHTIKLADEIKNFKEGPLLPAALIERLEKPCMSLVVWKPRDNMLEQSTKDDDEENNNEGRKRNGLLVSEHADVTGMDVEV